jgi:serine/threonine protein kinase
MQLNKETQKLLAEIGLEYIETILDRRGTLALRVLKSKSGKRAVLKLQSEDGSEEARHKAKLLVREAEMLSQAPELTNHLYVGHGESQGKYWLLLREVGGEKIHQAAKQIQETVIDQKKRISQLVELLLKVSSFYDALYHGGYLHGDVQPGHTYLEHNKATIIDWGLARKVDERNPLYRGGFVYFVAPEIAAGMHSGKSPIAYSPHAEVYAIGATLYMLYTGHLALDFGVPQAQLREIPMKQKLQHVVENRISSFEEVGADSHPPLEALMRKSLSTNPAERFDNPSSLHQHLRELGSL